MGEGRNTSGFQLGLTAAFLLPSQGAVSGSVQATDRLMKELRDIYRSASFKGGTYRAVKRSPLPGGAPGGRGKRVSCRLLLRCLVEQGAGVDVGVAALG